MAVPSTAMTQKKRKFSEFVDLLLARLYELEQQHGDRFFDLNAINRELKDPVPQQWVFDAGKILESRGMAQCIFAFGGVCQAHLTGEGRLFVEEERGTGIIHEYHSQPQQFVVNVSGTGNQVVIGGAQSGITQTMSVEETRKPAFELIDTIKKTLSADPSLSAQDRTDMLSEVGMVEQQLRKQKPNKSALAAMLEPLSQVASIVGNVANLIRLLNF